MILCLLFKKVFFFIDLFLKFGSEYEKNLNYTGKEEGSFSIGHHKRQENGSVLVSDPLGDNLSWMGIKSPSPGFDYGPFNSILETPKCTPSLRSGGFNSRKDTPVMEFPIAPKSQEGEFKKFKVSQASTQGSGPECPGLKIEFPQSLVSTNEPNIKNKSTQGSKRVAIKRNEEFFQAVSSKFDRSYHSQGTALDKNTGKRLTGLGFQYPKKEVEGSQPIDCKSTLSTTNKSKEGVIFCQCSKSECLKFYCQCFKNGVPCNPKCSCNLCSNIEHLPRREEAMWILNQSHQTGFNNPKAISSITTAANSQAWGSNEQNQWGNYQQQLSMDSKGRLYVKNGCSCKKIKCQKKYCMCYESGVACTELCRCDVCHNKIGLQKRQNGVKKEPKEQKKVKKNTNTTDTEAPVKYQRIRKRDLLHDRYNFFGFGMLDNSKLQENGMPFPPSAGLSTNSRPFEEVFSTVVKSSSSDQAVTNKGAKDKAKDKATQAKKEGKDLSSLLAELDETEVDQRSFAPQVEPEDIVVRVLNHFNSFQKMLVKRPSYTTGKKKKQSAKRTYSERKKQNLLCCYHG